MESNAAPDPDVAAAPAGPVLQCSSVAVYRNSTHFAGMAYRPRLMHVQDMVTQHGSSEEKEHQRHPMQGNATSRLQAVPRLASQTFLDPTTCNTPARLRAIDAPTRAFSANCRKRRTYDFPAVRAAPELRRDVTSSECASAYLSEGARDSPENSPNSVHHARTRNVYAVPGNSPNSAWSRSCLPETACAHLRLALVLVSRSK